MSQFGADQKEKQRVRELNGQREISGLGLWGWFFVFIIIIFIIGFFFSSVGMIGLVVCIYILGQGPDLRTPSIPRTGKCCHESPH